MQDEAITTTTTTTITTTTLTSTTTTATRPPVGEPSLGDVNSDGIINAIDASLVLAYYAALALKPNLTLEAFLDERK